MATSLDPDRWGQVKALLAPALEMPAEEVTAYLDETCTDPDLRRQVRTFLKAFHLDSDFLMSTEVLEPPSDAVALGEGSQIGAYCLTKKLGEGGMGEVFLATQEFPIRRTVAFKLIRPGLTGEQALIRFQAEGQTLALMSHPNIARIYDAGQGSGGRPYVVMEHIAGQPITDYCNAEQLTVEDRLRLFRQVLEGVRHAHRKGVIHRDLKPNNVLVAVEEKPTPKIIDFGIAKVLENDWSNESNRESLLLTKPGQWLGTPEYMSPEQAGGATGKVDIRSDVYSLGVLLYELLCGRLPLKLPDPRQKGLSALLEAINRQEPPRPSERLRNDPEAAQIAGQRKLSVQALERRLRGDIDRIVMRALAKDPAERYESAADLAEDLRRHLSGDLLLSSSPGSLEQMARWVRLHRLAASFTALLLLSLTAGIVGTTNGMLRARSAEETARAQTRKAQAQSLRAQEAADTAQQVTDFLISALDASDPTLLPQNELTFRQFLDNSAQRVRTELSAQPLVQAQLMLTMSYTYKSLGIYELAKRFAEDALKLVRGNPEESLTTARCLEASAEARLELEDYDVCLSHLEEALAIREELFGSDDVRLTPALHNLGMVYRRTGELELARSVLEQALELREPFLDENAPDIAKTLNNLGLVLHDLGENQLATTHLERSLRLHEKTLGPDHPQLSYSLNNLAMVRDSEGDFQSAKALFEHAVRIDRKAFGPNHTNVAIGLFNLGFLAKEHGDCLSALVRFRESQAILRKSLPEDHPKIAKISELIEQQRKTCSQ
ncbi:MAG: serine/threonine-protein kinase [Deltaproteobacteria bacterium]|nr:serine/threonine-protein kinase [Deltaproteobacteria bacterium]